MAQTHERVDARLALSHNLDKQMAAKHLTLEKLAEKSGLNISTISRIRAAEKWTTLYAIDALAEALGIQADQLLEAP